MWAMDLAHFGLRRRPFRSAPTPETYFPSETHAAAVARLRAAFDAGGGIALLDGDPGTGKTSVALRLLDALRDSATPVFLASARLTRPADLQQAILFDLGRPYQGLGESELRLAATEYWLNELAADRRGAIAIDEAHLLSPDLLEETRLIDNIEGRGNKAVFTLLVGQPSLRDTLARAGLEALAQRVSCRIRLAPLAEQEAMVYLRHQLSACGGDAEGLLCDEAAAMIAALGRGVPRVLNQLASEGFEVAAAAGQAEVDVEAVCEAAERLGFTTAGPEPEENPAEPAGSRAGEAGEGGEAAEPGRSRSPKQKARRRRAA
jgi:type II secretory pathway predicted ATPase ExeA